MPHTDTTELKERLDLASDIIEVGGTYRHRNGTLYRVETLVMRESDLSIAVIYRGVDNSTIPWERPIGEFLERFHPIDPTAPSPG